MIQPTPLPSLKAPTLKALRGPRHRRVHYDKECMDYDHDDQGENLQPKQGQSEMSITLGFYT